MLVLQPAANVELLGRDPSQPLAGRPGYPYAEEETRQVGQDAFVARDGSRYSVAVGD